MTKEEARLTLQENYQFLEFEHPGRIADAIKVALEALLQPSLPSNLDEAAEEYTEQLDEALAYVMFDESIRYWIFCSFKDGAKWMAKQGETKEGEVIKDIDNNLAVTAKGFSGKNAKFGDKVTVQIRK